jgi:cell division septation protein DedD
MVVVLHGVAGGWDELAIAVVALAVMWIAVKLAGRKPASDEEENEVEAPEAADGHEVDADERPTPPPARKLS